MSNRERPPARAERANAEAAGVAPEIPGGYPELTASQLDLIRERSTEVKSLLLFFDEIAVLLPSYMRGRHLLADPTLAGPSRIPGCCGFSSRRPVLTMLRRPS
jgi:hypothetical protein